MKRDYSILSVLASVLILLSACGPKATEEAGTEVATEAAETEVPATEVAGTEPATEVAVDLAGPAMEVGSTYLFIDGSILVAVPGGAFVMGDGGKDNPVHEVTVGDVWMHQTEVTNRMYGLCVAIGECSPPSVEDNPTFSDPLYANRPVVGVTYDQAAKYCKTFEMRLPTEAEWEKAASWDPETQEKYVYPWGDGQPTCGLENAGVCEGKTTDITEHPDGASPYLAVEMAGNAYEWAADWFVASLGAEAVENPLGPELGTKRSVRSAGYSTPFYNTAVARRWSALPTEHREDLGFRCVTEDPTEFAPMCVQLALTGLGPDGKPTGNPPSGHCDPPAINQVPFCESPTIVNFDPPGGEFSAPGCTPTGNPNQYLCDPADGPGPLTACGPCTLDDPGDWQCPEHYVKSGAGCTWDGSGTIGKGCLPGYNYDPVTQCCSATPGSAVDLGCPTGWSEFMDGCALMWAGGVPLCKKDVPIVYDLSGCGPDDGQPGCDPETDPNCVPTDGECPPNDPTCDDNGDGCKPPCWMDDLGNCRCDTPN